MYTIHADTIINNLDIHAVKQHAGVLLSRLQSAGVPKHSRVLIFKPQTAEYVCDLLALYGEYVAVVYDISSSVPELEHALAADQVSAILTHSDMLSRLPETNLLVLTENYITGEVPANAYTNDTEVVVWHSSGSTGYPKCIPVTKHMLESNINITIGVNALSNTDRYLGIAPVWHSYGCSLVYAGARVGSNMWIEGFNAFRLNALFNQYRPTWYAGVPATHQIVLDRVDYTGLRFIRSGTGPMSVELFAALEQKFQCPVIVVYGLAETGPVFSNLHQDRRPGSIGVPVNTQAKIVEGELMLQGDTIYQPGWFCTGDLAEVRDGYYYITGKIKEQINVAGVKVNPVLVEQLLLDQPGITDAACFAVPDERRGEIVGVAIVGDPAGINALPKKYRPGWLVTVDTIPRNYMSKIPRTQLYELFRDQGSVV